MVYQHLAKVERQWEKMLSLFRASPCWRVDDFCWFYCLLRKSISVLRVLQNAPFKWVIPSSWEGRAIPISICKQGRRGNSRLSQNSVGLLTNSRVLPCKLTSRWQCIGMPGGKLWWTQNVEGKAVWRPMFQICFLLILYSNASQELGCIRITWRACDSLIAGPHYRISCSVELHLRPENLHSLKKFSVEMTVV
jgi:hypothetical protein